MCIKFHEHLFIGISTLYVGRLYYSNYEVFKVDFGDLGHKNVCMSSSSCPIPIIEAKLLVVFLLFEPIRMDNCSICRVIVISLRNTTDNRSSFNFTFLIKNHRIVQKKDSKFIALYYFGRIIKRVLYSLSKKKRKRAYSTCF